MGSYVLPKALLLTLLAGGVLGIKDLKKREALSYTATYYAATSCSGTPLATVTGGPNVDTCAACGSVADSVAFTFDGDSGQGGCLYPTTDDNVCASVGDDPGINFNGYYFVNGGCTNIAAQDASNWLFSNVGVSEGAACTPNPSEGG